MADSHKILDHLTQFNRIRMLNKPSVKLFNASSIKKCLTIAGSDCSGGAGIQADLKTFAAHRVFGMSVIVSVVAENTARVIAIQDIEPAIIDNQLEAVFEDIEVDAIKIGMLSTTKTMETVAAKLKSYKANKTVIDPVMYAKNGAPLMATTAIDCLIKTIIPIATILTPNIPEAQKISGHMINKVSEMKEAAKIIYDLGGAGILIKGGHLATEATDLFYDGRNFFEFEAARINTKNTHGTGCTYSSAIAANLANGLSTIESIAKAKDYITGAIASSLNIGKGHGPLNHLYQLYP